MNSPLSHEMQSLAMNAICHEAYLSGQAWQQSAYEHGRPCVVFKPRLFQDGEQYCVLFGENIQEGVAGFGKSVHEAMYDFDVNWGKKLPDSAIAAQGKNP